MKIKVGCRRGTVTLVMRCAWSRQDHLTVKIGSKFETVSTGCSRKGVGGDIPDADNEQVCRQ